jgi:hypothetical protein
MEEGSHARFRAGGRHAGEALTSLQDLETNRAIQAVIQPGEMFGDLVLSLGDQFRRG